MKYYFSSIFLCLFAAFAFGQENLVNNPGFETNIYKKKGVISIHSDGKEVTGWRSPLHHEPELYVMPKKSVATAFKGSSAVGLILGSNKDEKTKLEYLTGELLRPLIKGQTYCISFSTLLHRTSRFAATDVGILLHKDPKVIAKISDPKTLTAAIYANDRGPVINTKWASYSGYYRATGGEKFISFGKFGDAPSVAVKDLGMEPYFELDGLQTKAYYQFDEISVKAVSDSTECGCATELPPVEELAEKPASTIPPYLFALDASGSMKKDGLFDSLRLNLVRFLNELPDGSPISFVTFASSARKVYAGEMEESTPNLVDSLLQRSPIGGGTNVFLGLQMAYTSWPTETPDSAKLVFISDGEFRVTEKIVALIKAQFDTYGRKLILIQIGARASGIEQLEPYLDAYIHTTASELSNAVSQLNANIGSSGTAVKCDCEEEFSDILNYHFVVDYSGSMAEEKTRAITAFQYLFTRAPANAFISVTTFTTTAQEIYLGKKSDITMARLSSMLSAVPTGGGTDPTPGVEYALKLAERVSKDRFSHIILITDLAAWHLSMKDQMGLSMIESNKRFDLAGSAIEVSSDGLIMSNSQFDLASGNYIGVSRMRFERDLFSTARSSCDYTSQTYHYNPTKARLKGAIKKALGGVANLLIKRFLS